MADQHAPLEQLKQDFLQQLGVSEEQVEISPFGEVTVSCMAGDILRVLRMLRDHPAFQFKQLIDLCGVDHLGRIPRFDVVYHLLSHRLNQRVRIIVSTEEGVSVPSVIEVFSCANWYERETHDLFGISFEGHPNLDRLLTDYEFEGHPLRKDFPLSGYIEPRYDEVQKQVVYEDVNLPQAYRHFDNLSPWEGMNREPIVLPGDEKATPPVELEEEPS